ncbi:hypothetical protein [Chondrinema litorale]|uniref:hypothetical protein n=1 Tax=Chondrinema litorale TaxID=2994555 RepID=UPI002543871A|nr:hypothetical protein [Chondrinema litorale]UZR98730.1 hypothetical protein OQ292_32495 [Chondrinema litorale]
MKPIKIILASNKKLIVQSIECVMSAQPQLYVVGKAYSLDQLVTCLKSFNADILLLDQQMLDDLYVWKNQSPKMIKAGIKVLLLIDKNNDRKRGNLPGFKPESNAYWENGPKELIKEILKMSNFEKPSKSSDTGFSYDFFIHGFNLN